MKPLQPDAMSTPASAPIRPRAGAVRARVAVGFLVSAPIMGVRGGPDAMLRWAAVIFVSLMIREFLRSLVGVARGHRATIFLTALGANTRFAPKLPSRQAIGTTLAGPGISVVMGLGLSYARHLGPASHTAWAGMAASFNLTWGFINLLPVLPFDGGRLLAASLGKRREGITMLVSIMMAEVAAAFSAVALRSPELAVLFLAAGVSSGWRWARSNQRRVHIQAAEGLRTANFLLASRKYPQAWAAAKEVATSASGARHRNAALTTLAWVALGEGEPARAVEALRHVLPRPAVDPYTLAAVQSAIGDPDGAIATLDHASRTTRLGRDAVRLLLDLHASSGNYSQVAVTAHEFFSVLGVPDVHRVVDALQRAGEPHLAAALTTVTLGIPISSPPDPGEPPFASLARLRKRAQTGPHGTR
jgi:Zn-dependent protease